MYLYEKVQYFSSLFPKYKMTLSSFSCETKMSEENRFVKENLLVKPEIKWSLLLRILTLIKWYRVYFVIVSLL